MELSYEHWLPAQKMAEHCRALVDSGTQKARECDALAEEHAAAAER